jgi:hypothetical protein
VLRLVVLIGSFEVLLLVGGWLEYQQWFVHPEYTKPQMFWAYWPVILSMFPVAALLVWAMPRK